MGEVTREEFAEVARMGYENNIKICNLDKDLDGVGKKLVNETSALWERIDSMVWKMFFTVTIPMIIGFLGIVITIASVYGK